MGETNEKRMIADTGYEVRHAVRIGGREIIVAENMSDPEGKFYMKAEYCDLGIMGQYDRIFKSDSYLKAMDMFTAGVDSQLADLRAEFEKADFSAVPITAEQCHPNDYGQEIIGEVVAIKASALRPEYRRGDVQLVFVTHGFGAKSNPMGKGVFCYHLSDGKEARFERHEVQGRIRELPGWAKAQLAALQDERENLSADKRQRLKDRSHAR